MSDQYSILSAELNVGGLRGTPIDSENQRALQELLEGCADFFLLVEHAPPGGDAARELLMDLPPKKMLTDKFVIGFWDASALIAVVDLIRDYPSTGDWWVGLLLVAPERRSAGLGARLLAVIERWVCAAGGKSLNLIVQTQNPGAVRFWRGQEFLAGEALVQDLGGAQNQVLRMRKPLLSDG